MRTTPYSNKQNCCGCGACIDICAKNAISMQVNEEGFEYPVINSKICIQCGLCQNCCPVAEDEKRVPLSQYAGVNRRNRVKAHSSSGGIFPAIVIPLINQGWYIFGAELSKSKCGFTVAHIGIRDIKNLERIQGSKYVKSDLTGTFRCIKKLLVAGESVVFSGTPCQVAAMKAYLKKDYPNLLLIDLVCHGVPSSIWWKESLKQLEKEMNGKIWQIYFRDNEEPDRCHYGKLVFENGQEIPYFRDNDCYYDLFLNSSILRESCYNCQFANVHRPGDITLGDFWNFGDEYDINQIGNSDNIDLRHGISCILANTIKGEMFLSKLEQDIWLKKVKLKEITDNNAQLRQPTEKGKNRKISLYLYRKKGFMAVNRMWKLKKAIKKLILK